LHFVYSYRLHLFFRALESELQAPFVRFEVLGGLLRQCVAQDTEVPRQILCEILEQYKLNESIAGPALRLLCKTQVLDDALREALYFYAQCESNENMRWIAIGALAELRRDQLVGIPQVVLTLLFGDDEDARNAAGALLGNLRLAETVRVFVKELDCEEVNLFSERRCADSKCALGDDTVLFEKEPLNNFCSLEWLLQHEIL
jgi:hypothetical protein